MEKIWKDEYVDSLGTMKFSGSQKAKMIQFLVNADSTGEGDIDMLERKRNRSSLPIKRLAIAGICVCTLVAGTAGANASGLLKPVSEVFGNILHLDGDTSEIVDKMGNGLGVSDSSAGVTITADAVLGDEYNYAIVFSIEKEDGTAFDNLMNNTAIDTWSFESVDFEEDPLPYTGGSGINAYFDDDNPEDSSVQFVSLVSNETKISGKKMTATFSNLGYEKDGEYVQVLKGNWKLNFPMDFPDSTVKLQSGQHLQTDGLNMVIQAVKISPIGFHIEFEDLDFVYADMIEGTENVAKENAFSDIPIVLVLSNGEKIEMASGSFIRATEEDRLAYTHAGIFDRIIAIDEMESICVGDITININTPSANSGDSSQKSE